MAEAKPVKVTVDAPKVIGGGVKAKKVTKKSTPFRGYLLTAGLDIGTSSSCYAYAFRTNPDNIHVSTFLPGKVSVGGVGGSIMGRKGGGTDYG